MSTSQTLQCRSSVLPEAYTIRLAPEIIDQLTNSLNRVRLRRIVKNNCESWMLVISSNNTAKDYLLPLDFCKEEQVVEVLCTNTRTNQSEIVAQCRGKLSQSPSSSFNKKSVNSNTPKRAHTKTIDFDELPCANRSVKKRTNPSIQQKSSSKLDAIRRSTPTWSVPSPSAKTSTKVIKSHSEEDGDDLSLSNPSLLNASMAAERPATSTCKATKPTRTASHQLLVSTDGQHSLEEEYCKRYAQYLQLDQWIDRRLSIFRDLKSQLLMAQSIKSTDAQTIIFRVIVEEKRLKADREYLQTMEKLEECYAALMILQSRLQSTRKSVAFQSMPN